MNVVILLCRSHLFILVSVTASSKDLSIFSSVITPEPCDIDDIDIDAPFVNEYSTDASSILLLFVNFYVNYHLMLKETSWIRSESCTNLWMWRYEFIRLTDSMSVWQNDISGSPKGIFED